MRLFQVSIYVFLVALSLMHLIYVHIIIYFIFKYFAVQSVQGRADL